MPINLVPSALRPVAVRSGDAVNLVLICIKYSTGPLVGIATIDIIYVSGNASRESADLVVGHLAHKQIHSNPGHLTGIQKTTMPVNAPRKRYSNYCFSYFTAGLIKDI
jgi:hypothetical protein